MGIKTGNFIERSLNAAALFLKDTIFAEEYALKNGFLQARPPRVKILAVTFLLIAALFTKSVTFLLALYILCLIIAQVSSVNIKFFLKRTWVFVPIFSLIIAIPALFAAFSPGEPIFFLKIFDAVFVITKQGAACASIFFMRVLVSVSLAALLVLTTRHFALLKALRSFSIPQVFVITMGMCYRYIYILLDTFHSAHMAIKSRVGFISNAQNGRSITAWNIASLWQRSYKLQNDVFNAMLSRGYSGELHVIDEVAIRVKDWFFIAVTVFISGLGIWKNYLN